MKIRSGDLLKLLVFLLLILIVNGCAGNKPASPPKSAPPPAPAPAPAPVPVERPKGAVSYHVWGALISYGIEQKEYPGYAAYTYVLFNSNQPDTVSPEGKRYDGILRAVLQDVKPQETGAAAGWPKDETNIFCIPFVTRSLSGFTSSSPAYPLFWLLV